VPPDFEPATEEEEPAPVEEEKPKPEGDDEEAEEEEEEAEQEEVEAPAPPPTKEMKFVLAFDTLGQNRIVRNAEVMHSQKCDIYCVPNPKTSVLFCCFAFSWLCNKLIWCSD